MDDTGELWSAIYNLHMLLQRKVNVEQDYQDYFESNPIAFRELNVDRALSFDERSTRRIPYDADKSYTPKPDFIGVRLCTNSLVIVELKTPFVGEITTSRRDGNRAKFKANAEQYISQVVEYVDSVASREGAREVVCRELKIDRISTYEAILVYARETENDVSLVSRLCTGRQHRLQIVYFDELLRRLVDRYSIGRVDARPRKGMAFLSHIALRPNRNKSPSYLFDYGSVGRNRISLIIHEQEITLNYIDNKERSHHLQALLVGEGPHYIRFEFSNDDGGIYLSLSCNNVESDLRVGRIPFDFAFDLGAMTVGADASGENGAEFLLGCHYVIGRTMPIEDRIGSYDYFLRTTSGEAKYVEFKRCSYLMRKPNGDLYQPKPEHQPKMTTWGGA